MLDSERELFVAKIIPFAFYCQFLSNNIKDHPDRIKRSEIMIYPRSLKILLLEKKRREKKREKEKKHDLRAILLRTFNETHTCSSMNSNVIFCFIHLIILHLPLSLFPSLSLSLSYVRSTLLSRAFRTCGINVTRARLS